MKPGVLIFKTQINSRALMMETKALWSKLVGRTSHTGKFWGQVRGPALRIWWRVETYHTYMHRPHMQMMQDK